MPKGEYDRSASRWRPRPLAEYSPELVARVRELYDEGMTMRETAEAAGTTVKILQRLMPRHGIERRRPGKREQRGELNDSWRGDEATYAALHLRVEAARGKPLGCSCCGADDPSIVYAWANLTGRYTDVSDYERMCPSCHGSYDATRRRLTGARTVPERYWRRSK